MQYHNITKDDMLNGDGLRVVLWVAGCGHACPGCHNPITWDAEGGLLFDQAAKAELFTELGKDYISGITFSGGDPLFPGNREEISELCREIRQKFPDKTIWLYTGYRWEEIKWLPFLDQIDVLNKSALIYIAAKNMGFEPDGMSQEQMKEMTVAFNLPK